MRSMLQIAIAIQDGQDVTLEEAKLACLAYSHMQSTTERELRELVEKVKGKSNWATMMKVASIESSFTSRFQGRKLPVDKFLGPNWMPGTPENDAIRKASDAILAKFAGDPKTNPVSAEVAREILKDRKGADA